MRTLVVGVGNPTRSDDGAGWAVAERIAALNLPDVEVRSTQQLQIELAGELAQFDRVIVVDAAIGGSAVRMRAIRAASTRELKGAGGRESARSSCGREEVGASHRLSLGTLVALADRLHGRASELLLCTLPGERFDFGTCLSPGVEAHVTEAVGRLTRWLCGSNRAETG